MNDGRTVFSQLMEHAPRHAFRQCVAQYKGDYRIRRFSCWDHFACMAFAQLTFRESLRDIEACLRALRDRLYHSGIRARISRNTLAVANEKRDWRIYAAFAQVLIEEARRLYADEPLDVELQQTVYALDTTTIDLCLSLFPWAPFRRRKAAIKVHTLLDLRGNIPTFIRITPGSVNEIRILDELIPEPGSIYVMDRGFTDFARLRRLSQAKATFVIRGKRDLHFRRRYSRPVDRSTGLRCDQTIVLMGKRTAKLYPEPLRRIRFYDAEHDRRLTFLTNDFSLPASLVASLYRQRWQVEIFFKWIKQHLRIKAFYGTSENAVKTQIWIAVSVYVLVAILAKRLQIKRDLYTILQILSVTLFEKIELKQALSLGAGSMNEMPLRNQLLLFDL